MATIFGLKSVGMLSMLVFLFSSTSMVLSHPFHKLHLPSHARGPVSLAFDKTDGGPYVGTSDGRILKYAGPHAGFVNFATTSLNLKSFTKMCQRTKNTAVWKLQTSTVRATRLTKTTKPDFLGHVCGRPLGLGFNNMGNKLYIADAYKGLLVVPLRNHTRKATRFATKLATSAEGVAFGFLNALDVDPTTGTVYFSDASRIYGLRDLLKPEPYYDATGRLLKYDPKTKQVEVLLTGLYLAYGVAVSKDGSFVLVSEHTANRIQKYWLKGPKANTSDMIDFSTGPPVNIKRTVTGDHFWVAVNPRRYKKIWENNESFHVMMNRTEPTAVQIDSVGNVMKRVTLGDQYDQSISEVQEVNGARYVGSPYKNYVGVFKIK